MPRYFIFFEHAGGLSLFDCKNINELAIHDNAVQNSIITFSKFSQIVKLFVFKPFPSTDVALETMNLLTEGQPSQFMLDFLATYLPELAASDGNKNGISLGVSEPKLGGLIRESLKVNCVSDDIIREIIRGIRQHFDKYLDQISADDLALAQLGLSHGYSRAKVKFNQHGDDNMIISANALLIGLDKDMNTFSMRLREWYSVHFPELAHFVEDPKKYSQCVQFIGNRFEDGHHLKAIDPNLLDAIVDDQKVTKQIIEAAQSSIGREVEDTDLSRIVSMAARVEALANYRQELSDYLQLRMHNIAPNLTSFIGYRIGALLIMSAGSLTNLAKDPASTIQLLGSEKALFNALKKHKPTPKYGVLFNSGPVSQAAVNDKGRMARSTANKCSICSRIDAFAEENEFRSGHFGLLMKEMMDNKLRAIATNQGMNPNLEDMEAAVAETRRYEQNEGAEEALNPDGMETAHVSMTPKEEPETPRRRRKKRHHHQEEQEQPQEQEQPAVETPAPEEPVVENNEENNTESTEHKKKRRRHKKSTDQAETVE